MMPGSRRTWIGKKRGMMFVARELASEEEEGEVRSTIGTDRIAPWAKRTPVPESRSSGSE